MIEVPHTQHLDRVAYVPAVSQKSFSILLSSAEKPEFLLHFLPGGSSTVFARKHLFVSCEDHPRDPSTPSWHMSEVQMFHSSGKLEFSVIMSRDSVRRGTYVRHFGWPFLGGSLSGAD